MRQTITAFGCRSAIMLAMLAGSLGCWSGSKPPPAVVASPPQSPSPPIESKAAAPTPAEGNSVETAETEVTAVANVPPPAPDLPAEKFLLLAPRGPLVIEFEIWIDGQPQAQVFDQLLDEVLKLADTDGDGQPMWKEVTASPKFRYGQFGNLPIDRENAPKQITQQYDTNSNGQVDRAELPRFLTRNAGGARAFSVRSIEQFHNRNRRGSPTWRAVDADDDGGLTRAELQQAAAQLMLHDVDDDEILAIDELRPAADVDPNNMRNRSQLGSFARLLGEHANWDSIRSALEEQYALGGTLGPDDFGLMSELFLHLDQDKDGRIGRKEWPVLNDVPAHLRFRVAFGGQPQTTEANEATTEPPPVLQLIATRLTAEQTAGAAPQISELSGRVVLRWPGVALTFVRNDTIAAMNYDALAQQGLTMYDANADGYLEAGEVNEQVQAQFARFEALDSDADSKVYAGEIAAFLRQRQGAQRAQVHTRAQDQEDALFLALDQNADDRLDAQELETAADRLAKLDVSGDGAITSDELPTGLAIVVARGSVENQNQLFAIGPVEPKAADGDLPKWFAAMDTSRDGVISAREFLGTAEKFAALDTNHNGFFESSEIPAATAETVAVETAPAEAPAPESPAPESERNNP